MSSSRSSAMPDLRAATSHPSPSPAMTDLPFQILLDQKCRTGYHTNSTCAESESSQGVFVEVSFDIFHPPAISLCFVRSYNLAGEPLILGAAGFFVLMTIPFSGNGSAFHRPYMDYFVYRSGPGIPSLHLLPRPYPTVLQPKMVAILPICDDSQHYAVVFLVQEYVMLEYRNQYTLHIYRSDRKAWCTKVARIAEETHKAKQPLDPTSAVYAGTGLIGWVDLWWGILLCNVLDEQPIMRFIPLPVPDPWQTFTEFSLEVEHLNPRPNRHVTIYNGLIKFIELKFYLHGCACIMKRVHDQCWAATTWTRPLSSDVWHKGLTFDTSDISVTNSSLLHLLPEILVEDKKLTWEKVISGGPTLSLHDDVVYIMAKGNLFHPTACVLAVNIRNLRLESCAPCSAGEIESLDPTYVPCVLSSYFDTTAASPP